MAVRGRAVYGGGGAINKDGGNGGGRFMGEVGVVIKRSHYIHIRLKHNRT